MCDCYLRDAPLPPLSGGGVQAVGGGIGFQRVRDKGNFPPRCHLRVQSARPDVKKMGLDPDNGFADVSEQHRCRMPAARTPLCSSDCVGLDFPLLFNVPEDVLSVYVRRFLTPAPILGALVVRGKVRSRSVVRHDVE